MTQNKKRYGIGAILSSIKLASFNIEIKKGKLGGVMVVTGIIGVAEFSEERVVLISHGGRLTVLGEGLGISTLENRTVEVFGKIMQVEMGYGKG